MRDAGPFDKCEAVAAVYDRRTRGGFGQDLQDGPDWGIPESCKILLILSLVPAAELRPAAHRCGDRAANLASPRFGAWHKRRYIMAIRILVTGGTFDKDYDELNGRLFFKDTHLAEMLRLGRSRVDVTIHTVMMIDSLEMTDADRALIVQNCAQCAEERVVITHGTDTMTETAAAIAAAVSGKTVVLTGAMIPYAFGSSDGLFNLGSALSFVQILPPGIYVAMNGKCFPWNRVRKNRERGEFEELPPL
jgi:L-asparaginase